MEFIPASVLPEKTEDGEVAVPDLTFSCEYSDILYNILHLSAVGSRVHTDAAA